MAPVIGCSGMWLAVGRPGPGSGRARDEAGHSILTTDTGNACGLSERPFVSDCDYDQAGAILKWIYGELNAPAERPKGKFLVFAQSPYAEGVGNGQPEV